MVQNIKESLSKKILEIENTRSYTNNNNQDPLVNALVKRLSESDKVIVEELGTILNGIGFRNKNDLKQIKKQNISSSQINK